MNNKDLLIPGLLIGAALLLKNKNKSITGNNRGEKLPNYHLIEIKYLPATDKNGAKIKISSARFNVSKTISAYHDDFTYYEDIAQNFLESHGMVIIGIGQINNKTDVLISTTFRWLLNKN